MITDSSHSKHLLLLVGLMALTFALMLASPARAQVPEKPGYNAGPSNLNTLNFTGPVTSVYVPPQARQTAHAREQAAATLLNAEAQANFPGTQPVFAPAQVTGGVAATGATMIPGAASMAATNPAALDGGVAWPVMLGWMIVVIGAVCLVLILGVWTRRNRPPSHRPTLPPDRHIGLPV